MCSDISDLRTNDYITMFMVLIPVSLFLFDIVLYLDVELGLLDLVLSLHFGLVLRVNNLFSGCNIFQTIHRMLFRCGTLIRAPMCAL